LASSFPVFAEGEMMHELSIARSLIALATEAADGRRIFSVTVEIGTLSGVMTDALAFCLPEVARGTRAEAANFDIRRIAASAKCHACDSEFPMPDLLARCPCGARDFTLLTGEELNLTTIEIEEAA
jgi:hydrogenase nickel incorporation protein HypA/HybF